MSKVEEVCNLRYQDIYARYAEGSSNIIVSHFGEFTQELVNSISNNVEELMFEAGDKKGTVKRMFSILVEGLQNIRLHGEKDGEGKQTSFVVVSQNDDSYLVTMANLIFNRNIEKIEGRLKQINSYDQAEIKQLYMEVLTNGEISTKGGAGLGFITMAMKSKNPVNYKIEEIDENLSCFSIEILLNRKK